jgi:hypothetical protein
MRTSLDLLLIYLRDGSFGDRFACPAHGNQYAFDCESCRAAIEEALHNEEVQRLCVVVGRSCSWCNYINEVSPMESRFCAQCGHCAQLPRIECVCPRCQKGSA